MKSTLPPESKDKPLSNMPTPSIVTCKINKRFADLCTKGGTFKFVPQHRETRKGYGAYEYDVVRNILTDGKKVTVDLDSASHQLSCCGICELTLSALQPVWVEGTLAHASDDWYELVAKFIHFGVPKDDSRIAVVGLPVRVGASSVYNIDFYDRMLTILTDFGFKQIGTKYVNENSKNTIVVMAVQL